MIIAGTGHRPDKLGGYGTQAVEGWVDLAEYLLEQWRPEEVISGLALGWDTYLAVAAQRLGIPVIGAIPFMGQESRWPAASQAIYWKVVDRCNRLVCISPGDYSPRAMQERNEWMVRNSDFILCCWDGSAGGTGNCVEFAKRFYGDHWEKRHYNCFADGN